MTETVQERLPGQKRGLKKRILENPCMILFAVISFVCLFVFYSKVHPLYIHDLDDWLYVYNPRAGYPDVKEWNPTKVLPETLMPLISYIGAYFGYPITGDYIQALCDVYAVTVAALIMAYMLLTAKLLRKQFQMEDLPLTLVMAVFLLGHFVPFLTKESGNQHLFYSINVTCIFNYLIPGLWNIILCLYFLNVEKSGGSSMADAAKKGVLIWAVYLAIFSSLWHSVILMSLFGMRLLFALIEGIAENKREGKKAVSWPFLLGYAREHLPKLLALCAWFLAMVMEVTGYRATMNPVGGFRLKASVKMFLKTVLGMRKDFLAAVCIMNLLALGVALYRRKKTGESGFILRQLEILGSMLLCGTFIVLVGAKVSSGYLTRADVQISWMLWLMLLTVCSLAYLIKAMPKILWLLPVMLYVLFFTVVIQRGTYAEHYFYKQTPAVVKAVDDDIIAQIREAEQAGETSVEVHIPVQGSDGWPLDQQMTPSRIAGALYAHGITKREMDVSLVPDPQKDLELHVLP